MYDSAHKQASFRRTLAGRLLRPRDGRGFSEKCGVSKLYPLKQLHMKIVPPPLPSSLAITIFKMHRSNFCEITRFETLATQATS